MAEESNRKKRKHLSRIVSEEAHDGSFVHHHTYRPHRDDPNDDPERRNVATSSSPEEAGQHVTDQFAMNEPPEGAADPAAAAPAAGAPDPAAAAQ